MDARLAPHPVKPGQMCVNPLEGKKSKTEFEVLEQFSDWTLLRAGRAGAYVLRARPSLGAALRRIF